MIGQFRKLNILLAAAALAATSAMAGQPQISGAIFTTNLAGDVNVNIYDSKDDVYLNGGPQGGQQLTPGIYYFQVTDPSGATLLSTDAAACRQVVVGAAGGITGVVDNGCFHATATNPVTGFTIVQLQPFNDTPNPGGEYKAWLILASKATANGALLEFDEDYSKTDNFKVKNGSECTDCEPGAVSIGGFKFYDANTNGAWDQPGELGIEGFRIVVTINGVPDLVYTDASGAWEKTGLFGGDTYHVCETLPLANPYPWYQTAPALVGTTRCWDGVVGEDVTKDANLDFGNVCVGPGGGLTLGFWSNKNGAALIDGSDLGMLSSLNLKTASGGDFDPATYTQFRTWILNATATNMAYMLSAQLAAMELNVYNGKVSGSALVFADALPAACSALGVDPGVNQAGFTTISNLMNAANSLLASYPNTVAASDARTCEEYLKTNLDRGNNNLTFVQPNASYCGTLRYPAATP